MYLTQPKLNLFSIKSIKKEKKMPFIEIITDSKSQTQLNKVITKKMVNDCDILFIKDKNIENTKNIKLETLVLNRSVENDELMSKIMKNSKNLILNLDLNENLQYEDSCNVISYGYSSKSVYCV